MEENDQFKIPARGIYTEDARKRRMQFIEQHQQQRFPNINDSRIDPTKLTGNIECLIGSIEIPVGIAGPLKIEGDNTNDIYYLPMATTEGALIASVTRGATAITNIGGAKAYVLDQRMSRVPLFTFETTKDALLFSNWVSSQIDKVHSIIKQFSNHAKLTELSPEIVGRNIHLRFIYSTGNAAGQNMTTTCTWEACNWLKSTYKKKHPANGQPIEFIIEGNGSNDKKVTYNSFINTRGTKVVSECVMSNKESLKTLKVSTHNLFKAYLKVSQGGVRNGMVGMNINIGNVIAAAFIATGQDVASVHESSIGLLSMELLPDDHLYISMTLPSLIVGTIGGGTHLPHQREALNIIGCTGENSSKKLAEIIASFCLALDISTLAAIASDQFAKAHEKLGRNKPIQWLEVKDITPSFFSDRLSLPVKSCEQILIDQGSSIITELTSSSSSVKKFIGLLPYKIGLQNDEEIKLMMKIKPLDTEILIALNALAANAHPDLAITFDQHKFDIDPKDCHIREVKIALLQNSVIKKYMPKTYAVSIRPEKEEYIIFQELLENMKLMNTISDISGWTQEAIYAAIDGIGEIHGQYYDNTHELLKTIPLATASSIKFRNKKNLWQGLFIHAQTEYPQWFNKTNIQLIKKIIDTIENWYPHIDNGKKTLIHNDFNPRNIAFREDMTLCVYDWELAMIHLPQHDVVELLAFSLNPEEINADLMKTYSLYHKKIIENSTSLSINDNHWLYEFKVCIYDFVLNRLMMYVMAHTFREYDFLERTFETSMKLLEISEDLHYD